MASKYELGYSAGMEKGVAAVRVLMDKLAAAKRDSAEWKEQHENLLAMYRAEAADAARFRWWLKLWAANTDESMDALNDVVSKPRGPAAIRKAIDDAMIRRRSDRRGANG